MPAEAICKELWQRSSVVIFSIMWLEVEFLGIRQPLLRRQHRNRKWKERHNACDQQHRIHPHERIAPRFCVGPRSPRNTSGSKEHWISRGQIIVLGMKRHHQRKKENVEHSQKTEITRAL